MEGHRQCADDEQHDQKHRHLWVRVRVRARVRVRFGVGISGRGRGRGRGWGRGRLKDEHKEQHRHLSGCLVPRGQRGHELEAEIVETRPRLGGERKVVVERLSAQKLTQTLTQAWPPESRSC